MQKAANENKTDIIYYLLSKEREMKEYCFANTKIKKIAIPPNITFIPKGSFYKCSLLTDVSIPPSVTSIKRSAFNECVPHYSN